MIFKVVAWTISRSYSVSLDISQEPGEGVGRVPYLDLSAVTCACIYMGMCIYVVDVSNVHICREFLWIYWSQKWWHIPGSTISDALENNGFAVSSMPLKLRRACKEGYMEVGESKVRIGWQDVYQGSVFSWVWLHLRGVLLLAFQRCFILHAMDRAGLKTFH